MENGHKSSLAGLAETGLLDQENPDIVAIFQQIKNLRDSERSIRSLRRSLTLDNMPVIEEPEELGELDIEHNQPAAELSHLLENYLDLKREKNDLEARFNRMIDSFARLQDTVDRQAAEIEALKQGQ